MNILSIDGGGARGIIPLLLLKEIVDRASQKTKTKLNVVDLFDFFSGSSIGTLIISSLLLPDPLDQTKPKYSIDDIIDIFISDSQKFFDTTYLQNLRTLWGFRLPKYDNDPRPDAFNSLFKEITFGQLLKPIVFPCGDTLSDQPVYFDNQIQTYKDLKVCEILLGTTGAPTYFQSKELIVNGQNTNLIDSGCVVNDTSALAFLTALKSNQTINKDQFYEISFGTGQVAETYQSKFWGMAQWLPNIITSLIDLNCENQEHELSLITNSSQYDRFNPTIPYDLDYLDQPQYMPQYIAITKNWITTNSEKIDSVVTKLTAKLTAKLTTKLG